MDDGAMVAICGGGVNLCDCERLREASCDITILTGVILDAWCIYDHPERCNGGTHNLDYSECNDQLLGCNSWLFSDFCVQLPCQFTTT